MTRLGVPQPSSSIGPMMKPPRLTGNIVRSVLMICGALATGFSGNSTASSEPVAEPCDSAGGLAVCCTPIRPPMPVSVKPNESWIGGNCPKISSSSEKPASDLRVEQRDRLHADREHLELEDRRRSRSVVDAEVAAALDDAGVERRGRCRSAA